VAEKKRKEKKTSKKKIRTVLFRNPKAQLTGCMGPPGFRKVLGLGGVKKLQALFKEFADAAFELMAALRQCCYGAQAKLLKM
jgi:hypothetical protein